MTRTRKMNVDALAALLLSLLLCAPSPAQAGGVKGSAGAASAPRPPASPGVNARTGRVPNRQTFGQLPASFELNAGQADARVKFLSRGSRHTLLLGADGAWLALRTGSEEGEGAVAVPRRRVRGETASDAGGHAPSPQLLRMKFVGANPRAAAEGERELKGRVNYFVGQDPSKWRANVPTYARVRYRNLYRGVDLVYHGGHGSRGQLEYDFVLAPGADASSIRVRFEGAERLSVDEDGALLLRTQTGTLRQSRPFVYQEARGARREVAGRYVLLSRNEVGFRVGAYDRAAPLVIDPVLVYSTYFLAGERMAVDAAGGVYVVGTANFVPIPLATPGAFQTTRRGTSDAFVAKLDAAGDALVYVTYLGGTVGAEEGSGGDAGTGIAVDASGRAYVAGQTFSTDFPTTANAFQPAYGGGFSDGFVTKLNADGSALVYSTYLGGMNTDACRSIAVDAAGQAYVAGETDSADFPVRNALQPTKKGVSDFFVAKLAPAGSALDYSTYLGGSGPETGFRAGIAIDAAGAAYVTGSSSSTDYPVTPDAFQPTLKAPGVGGEDVVVTKLAPGGGALAYSTYLGGADPDFGYDIAVDAAGQAHVAGSTFSPDFPTLNALHPAARDPQGNGFLSKLNAAGTALVYSTYLSGTPPQCGLFGLNGVVICGGEDALGVATDAAGNAYVTGNTLSKNFPAPVNALQSTLSARSDTFFPEGDAYLIKLNPAGQAIYSTYLGGSAYDYGADVQSDAAGTAYVLGGTNSHDFPTVNPFADNFTRELDASLGGFVLKVSDEAPPGGVSTVRFDSATYAVDETGASVVVGVTRGGDTTRAVSVDYATGDRTASERSDYTTARGRLTFAPGETAKTFAVFVTDDKSVEGDETLSLTLHDLRGDAVLAAPASAVVTVRDDDEHPTNTNPIDTSAFFVRQHYLDFLSREPDAAGLQFWTSEIDSCGADLQCREMKRINTSAAFFLSIEFQETGFLVERFHRLAFTEHVRYETFIRDAHELGEGVVVGVGDWRARLDANRRAYADEFAARSAFEAKFPESLSAAQYVDQLNTNSGDALSGAERDALVAGLQSGQETRATVLLKIADDEDFRRREFNPAFVLMQYLGYLRRDPDDPPDNTDAGYQFWLRKLDQFGGDWRAAEMVRAFVSSIEYRARFNEPAKEAALGTPFTLGFRETAVVLPDKLKVSFIDIGFDSRCPRDAQCPVPGGVNILLRATKPGGDTARFILRIAGGVPRPHPDNPPVSALGYRFRLLQLDPEPPHGLQSPPFQALLLVERV